MNDPKNQIAEKRPSLFRNWISLVGMVVGIGALFSFLLLFMLDAIAKFSNPYVSILTYMGVPAFLIGGIVLAFVGAWRERRRRAHGTGPTSLQIDLNRAARPAESGGVRFGQHRFPPALGGRHL